MALSAPTPATAAAGQPRSPTPLARARARARVCAGFAHTAPPLAFQDEGSQDHLLRVCKALLRRGMQRAQRDFVALLRTAGLQNAKAGEAGRPRRG